MTAPTNRTRILRWLATHPDPIINPHELAKKLNNRYIAPGDINGALRFIGSDHVDENKWTNPFAPRTRKEILIRQYAEQHTDQKILNPHTIARSVGKSCTVYEVSSGMKNMYFDRLDDCQWRNPYSLEV